MTAAPCSRAWEAEAMTDGRLSAADARSFRRHAAGCDACQDELAALAALGELGERLPLVDQNELERRRARQELLRRANTLSVGREEPARWKWAFAVAGICIALASASVLGGVGAEHEGATTVPAPEYRVAAEPTAAWTLLERGATLRLGLTRGRLEVAVDKLEAGQRFLITLPDGELEVRGTRFVVVAEGGRTRSVAVSEGAVSLALRGQPRLLLERGEAFPRATEASAAAPDAAAPVARDEAPVARDEAPVAPHKGPSPLARDGRGLAAAPRGAPPAESSASATPSAPTFAQAMAAFAAGDYGRAEALFRTFERESPGDARVEDTTFLRAVARKRRGDASGAEAAAREYLRKYPGGLRRLEAERLLGQRDAP